MSAFFDLLARMGNGQVLKRSGKTLVGVDPSALTPAGNFVPATDNAYDLGESTTPKRWRRAILSGYVVVPTIGPAAAQQHTLPAVTSDTIALLAAAQTLTNKTLTSPRVGTALLDANGNEVLRTPATASAVNDLTIQNSATGTGPEIYVSGDDTNASLGISPKGTGTGALKGGGGAAKVSWSDTGVAFNGVAPVARQLLATGASATVDDVITLLQNCGLARQS